MPSKFYCGELNVSHVYVCPSWWMTFLLQIVLHLAHSRMRAAAVTEKASRVAPLVNSWTFVDHEDDHSPAWMDLGRQRPGCENTTSYRSPFID